MRKPVAIAGFVIGFLALALQFSITIPASMQAGRSLPLSIIYFFSFFTILTNILLALIYAGAFVRGQSWLSLFRKPVTRATAAACITLVGGFYHFVLASLWQPEGLFWVCDMLLHYVAPIIYLIWFASWNRTGTLKFSKIPVMLVYPLVYLVYVLFRGEIVHEYPYPVLNALELGYGQVAINVLGLLVILSFLSALAVMIDRSLLSGKRAS